MKQYLVQLNHPVIGEAVLGDKTEMKCIYGFLGAEITEDEEENAILENEISDYVGYLAAMHVWQTTNGDVEFSLDDELNWIDSDGNTHPTNSEWALEIGYKYMRKIDLDFELYQIDLDGIGGLCLDCGREQSLITCDSLMNNLVRFAEQQEEEESKVQYNVVLFNRPIWLPKQAFWSGQEGFCHIYGLVLDREINDNFLHDCDTYLGYLAMCEEYALTGKTPSGYTTKDGRYFYKDGKEYFAGREEIQEECRLCHQKYNLKCHHMVVRMSREDIEAGAREELILAKWLYDSLIEETGLANDEKWMSKID